MTYFDKKGIYFLPLGGADEIGMNMYVYAVDGKMIVVDAGYGFLQDNYPGMELAYASPDFLDDYRSDIVGLFITHGHEDHMGAIAQIWPHLQCPVYAMDYTLGLIRSRLDDFKMTDMVPLISVNQQRKIEVENFSVEFISLAHSVPQTCGLAIRTKYGNVFHATDWRFDDEEISTLPTDYKGLRRFAKEGVDLLVCDSTNIMVEKNTPTEADVRKRLMELIPQIEGGLFVTCFSSNLMRLESLVMAAQAAGRTPVMLGQSITVNVKVAKECGYLQDLPEIQPLSEVNGLTSDKALYICTGSQANYRSALSIIANGENKHFKLSEDDTIIFSSKMIPGNIDKVEKMQEKLEATGAHLITDETDLVHASGHAGRKDLKKMYNLLKPKIVLPVHGDKRFIRAHKRFALECGVQDVFSTRNGDLCLLQDGHIDLMWKVPTDILGWDRRRSVSLNSQLVRNRRRIAFNCSVFISAVIKDHKLLDFKVSSIDILPEEDWAILEQEICTKVRKLAKHRLKATEKREVIEEFFRTQVRKKITAVTDIRPVPFLHITYLDDLENQQEENTEDIADEDASTEAQK